MRPHCCGALHPDKAPARSLYTKPPLPSRASAFAVATCHCALAPRATDRCIAVYTCEYMPPVSQDMSRTGGSIIISRVRRLCRACVFGPLAKNPDATSPVSTASETTLR